jgi:large subunit ribosomal protein L17
MRHRKSGRKLKRTASHRRATLAALSTAVLRHKRITTTVAKAKEARVMVEKIITRARRAVAQSDKPAVAIHARREVGKLIKDKSVVGELFTTIVEKVGSRPGGYTRVVRLGQRLGDAAELAVLELVDFNTGQTTEKPAAPVKKKKSAKPEGKKEGQTEEKKEGKKEAKKEGKKEGKKKTTAEPAVLKEA